jgi:hypothetical protein
MSPCHSLPFFFKKFKYFEEKTLSMLIATSNQFTSSQVIDIVRRQATIDIIQLLSLESIAIWIDQPEKNVIFTELQGR